MLEVSARLTQGHFNLDASVAVRTDAITALFGPSGAGKSTLLAAIAGLKRLDDGKIVLNQRILEDTKGAIRIPCYKRGVGLMFQEAFLFPHMNVRQNIAYARKRAPHAGGLDITDVAAFFRIQDLLDRPVRNLSGGEKNRVALARALVCQPEFLLLDEPFAALDGALKSDFMGILLEAHRTYAIPMLVVTHSIDEAATLASHLVMLDRGRVGVCGTMAEVGLKPEFAAILDRHDVGAALPAASLRSGSSGAAQNLWLRADQVLLSLKRPEAISARNIIESRICNITASDDDGVLVRLESPFGGLLSRVTMDAARELALAPGTNVWAIVKAHSFSSSRAGPP